MNYDEMVATVKEWLMPFTDHYGFGTNDRLRFERRDDVEERGVVHLATASNQYTISFAEGHYLGCIAGSRIVRAGETWTRGNDLPDGPFSRETFDNIMRAIVGYELVRLEEPVSGRDMGEPPEDNDNDDNDPSLSPVPGEPVTVGA